jgi:hypothetical protein
MNRRIVLILAGFVFAASGAFAQEAVTPTGEGAAAPELKALADSCAAHKFETLVVVDGSGHGKKVRICGKPGQSDAEWLVTLTDSAKKVEADEAMARPVRDQIIAALKAEIGRLESGAPAPAATSVATSVATIAMPSAPVVVPEAVPQYSKVPPMPVAKPRAAGSLANSASAPIIRPRITIRCALPREAFAGCAGLVRETQLLIRADEDLAPGASLRFLRGGDARAELDLGPLKKGESLREKLPGRVCSGVLRGKVEVQVLSKNQVAETLGPYALYCGS